MAIPRTAISRTAADDDAVAAVVGFVLILAVAISYYAYVAHNDVPRWGEENEHNWNDLVGAAMMRMTREGDSSIGSHISVAGSIPRPPEPNSFDVPLVGRTQPIDPSGSVRFDRTCSGFEINRTFALSPTQKQYVNNSSVGGGCIQFTAQPVYTPGFGYIIENGGLLRVQGVDSFMAAGPPLSIRALGDRYDITLTAVQLDGPGASSSVTSAHVPIDLIAGNSRKDIAEEANVVNMTWTVNTTYPKAWAGWINQRIAGSGMDANLMHNAACYSFDHGVANPSPAPACASLGIVPDNKVIIILNGAVDNTNTLVAGSNVNDMSFTLTQGTYTVAIR